MADTFDYGYTDPGAGADFTDPSFTLPSLDITAQGNPWAGLSSPPAYTPPAAQPQAGGGFLQSLMGNAGPLMSLLGLGAGGASLLGNQSSSRRPCLHPGARTR